MAGRGAIPIELSPDFTEAIRHAYVDTDQTTRDLCAEFGISLGKLDRLIKKHGWPMRCERPPRDLPPALKLREETRRLLTLPPRSGGEGIGGLRPPSTGPSTPMRSIGYGASSDASRGGGNTEAQCVGTQAPPTPDPSPPLASLVEGGESAPASVYQTTADAIDRLEALLLQLIAVEEAALAQLGSPPRDRAAARDIARTVSILTQALKNLRQLRPGPIGVLPSQHKATDDDDDMPADLDDFRYELARRINAFVESRTGGGNADRDPDGALVEET